MDQTQDFDAHLQGLIREEVAKLQTTPQQVAQNAAAIPHEPLSLTIAGQEFKYGSKAELETALNQFAAVVGQKINAQEGELAALKTAPANSQGSYVTGNEPVDRWNDAEFVKRMTESPREGLKYWLNEEVFDGKSENPVHDLKRNLQEVELTKRSIAAYQFKENHKEFPGGTAEAQVIDNVRQQMNLPYDYMGLEAAYLMAIQRGALPNYQQIAQAQAAQLQAQQQNQQGGQNQNPYAPQPGFQPNPYLQAPPGVNRNAPAFQANPYDEAEKLTTEQIEDIFARTTGQQFSSRR